MHHPDYPFYDFSDNEAAKEGQGANRNKEEIDENNNELIDEDTLVQNSLYAGM